MDLRKEKGQTHKWKIFDALLSVTDKKIRQKH